MKCVFLLMFCYDEKKRKEFGVIILEGNFKSC